MIIDTHAHIYPSNISEKATRAIGDFYSIKMSEPSGNPELLISEGKKAGITNFVVHSTATTVHQVRKINEFIAEECRMHKEFIGYMTLHPDMEYDDIAAEIAFAVGNGLRGIKLHPDFQKFAIDEERATKIYENARGKLPILFHTGDKRYNYSNPHRLAQIAKKYPDLICIGAHFGGYSEWDKIDCYSGIDNVFFDTCSTMPFNTTETVNALVKKVGADRLFFGTDFPMAEPITEMSMFDKLNLSSSEREKVLYKNYLDVILKGNI